MAWHSALYHALTNAKVHTTHNQWFIPIDSLNHILTETTVRDALQTSYYLTTDVDALVRKICHERPRGSWVKNWESTWKLDWLKDTDTTCRRLFAILVLIDKAQAHVVHPIVETLCDLDLPLAKWSYDCRLSSRHDAHYTSYYGRPMDVSCFHTGGWTVEDRERFVEVQWSLMAPIMEKPAVCAVYPDMAVLPLSVPRRNRLAHKDDIFKAMVYGGHHRFPDSKHGHRYCVAIKQVQPPANWDQSRRCMLRALAMNNSHIVRLLNQFCHRGGEYLIFPWPEGTFRDLWATTPQDVGKEFKLEQASSLKRWLMEQCLGLAKALGLMHGFSYAHGHIQPENIFWYYQKNSKAEPLSLGTLEIFDDVIDAAEHASQPSLKDDIWALGCVYLEFITWYVLGPGAVDTPGAPAQLGDPMPDKVFMQVSAIPGQDLGELWKKKVVNQAAQKFERVFHHERYDDVLRRFVDFVFMHMLLTDGVERVGCQEVVQALGELIAEV